MVAAAVGVPFKLNYLLETIGLEHGQFFGFITEVHHGDFFVGELDLTILFYHVHADLSKEVDGVFDL
jgi:hypothetical protein